MPVNELQKALFNYCLRLGDTSLILGHRVSEWCGHGPILEEDIAMTNISLDLIGQARIILSYAGKVEGKGRTEDDLAYQRDQREFFNALLSEQANGDFACTMLRQYFVSCWQFFLYSELTSSKDKTLAAFAEKSLKEVIYHMRHSGEWVKRMGDGTVESKERMQAALNDLWMYTGDLFDESESYKMLLKENISADLKKVKQGWDHAVNKLISDATLVMPEQVWMLTGSETGTHTEQLGFILAEMQFLPRAYPGTSW